MKRLIFTAFIGLLTIFLAACGEADMEGIILEIDYHDVLLSQNMTLDEYADYTSKSHAESQNGDVTAERDDLDLIILTSDDVDKLHKGDEIEAWIAGEVLISYPGQANAKKIKVKE